MFIRSKNNFAPSVDSEAISSLPLIYFDGPIYVIDEYGRDFDLAVKWLKHHKVIGFDTETRPVFSSHSQQNGVALLQLSTGHRAFLFRLHRMGLDDSLTALLADADILKVGASVHDDIRGLQKLTPFSPAGFVDLQRICGEWGIMDKSVKKMTAIVLGKRISKTQQLSNWEAPQLSDAQKVYAATDAWICREMYFKLKSTAKKPVSTEETK